MFFKLYKCFTPIMNKIFVRHAHNVVIELEKMCKEGGE